ncbi:MAG: FecR family protein [Candidatus Shapirobacteria bacterium]
MKKLVLIILSVLSVLVANSVHAVDHPQGNFVLAGGKIRMTDEADPFERIDKTFFASIIVPVKDGEINFFNTRPIDLESGSQHFVGKMELSLKGNYDKETGVISANFTQSNENSYERKTGNGIRVGSGTSVFVGTAKGTVIDNQVVLSFEGKLSGESVSEANDKHVDNNSSNNVPWVKKVEFGTSEWVVQAEEEKQEAGEPPRDSGIRMSDVSGQVEIACPPDLEAWDVLKMGRVLYVDCHIKTGENSKAVISFPDMTTFEMKPESEIVLDTPPEKDSKLKLLAGNIWANVKKMVKDGTMEVHMGQAVAGIKGTTFVLEERENMSTLKVIEGGVAFKSKVTNDEKSVNPGEMLSATSAGLGEIKTFDVASESALWESNKPTAETNKNTDIGSTLTENTVDKSDGKNYTLPIAGLVVFGIGGFVFLKRKQSRL